MTPAQINSGVADIRRALQLAKDIVANVGTTGAYDIEQFNDVQTRLARMLERAELGQFDMSERDSLADEIERLRVLTTDSDADWWKRDQ